MSHHFHPIVVESSSTKRAASWKVTFRSTETGAKIVMRIPCKGVFDDPDSHHQLKRKEVVELAEDVAEVLERRLAE